jgi:mRNA interferase MazF
LRFTPQTGREQAGRRPALVLSPRAYNRKVGLAVCCPITSAVKGYPFEVVLPDGLPAQGAVLCDQVRSLDWRSRSSQLLCAAPSDVLTEATAKILALIDPD